MNRSCKNCWSYAVCISGQKIGHPGACWEPKEGSESADARLYRYPQMEKRIAQLEAENEKLREALKFYAEGTHYESDVNWCEDGAIARKALGESS